MKIVPIFADKLFAFHYENEVDNEYDRLMELWTDVKCLKEFAISNNIANQILFIKSILNDAEQIQDLLEEIVSHEDHFEYYFRPLHDTEIGFRILSLQKGKIKKNQLRLYAIRIDENCFVITGGAIKMSQKMQDHPETNNELEKLNSARSFLKDNEVLDSDSFYELLNENL